LLMEASTRIFTIAHSVNKQPGVVACVINPHTTHINETKKKTDKEDSLFLARLFFRTLGEELQLVSIPSTRRWQTQRWYPTTGRLWSCTPNL